MRVRAPVVGAVCGSVPSTALVGVGQQHVVVVDVCGNDRVLHDLEAVGADGWCSGRRATSGTDPTAAAVSRAGVVMVVTPCVLLAVTNTDTDTLINVAIPVHVWVPMLVVLHDRLGTTLPVGAAADTSRTGVLVLVVSLVNRALACEQVARRRGSGQQAVCGHGRRGHQHYMR